ncbi:MAG: 1-phosphofructokinase family hexose kinase [Thiohalospira sp.]
MKVLTLTMNPVLDRNTSTKMVMPDKKVRCTRPELKPGGGGINVSRAIQKLGYESSACALAGGTNRGKIEDLLAKHNIKTHIIDSGTDCRENLFVFDETTGQMYRFIMPGDHVIADEEKILQQIKDIAINYNYVVASGSLLPGISTEFYAKLAKFFKENDIKFILDTSGPALKNAIQEGVYLIKPNLRELASLVGKDKLTGIDQEKAANEILEKGQANVIVLSLGAKGAMLAQIGHIIEYITPPTMPIVSPVGAGDSMVAGIITGFIKGFWPTEAIRYGVAAGTAAAMQPGSELCTKEDTDRIWKWLKPD